jgi:hypothetical protein
MHIIKTKNSLCVFTKILQLRLDAEQQLPVFVTPVDSLCEEGWQIDT